MEVCKDIDVLDSVEDAKFKAWTKGTLVDYKVCKLKQAILADCITRYNMKSAISE